MFPVKYELGSYIAEDTILHSDRRENLKSYIRVSTRYSVTRNLKAKNCAYNSPVPTPVRRYAPPP
jgi:hypothetical protein